MATLIAAKELAVRLALDEKTVLKYARCGILPCVRFTKRCVRFPLEECGANHQRQDDWFKLSEMAT